ncbi:MAG: ROK family protein [Trueperaceae bacterium]
MSHSGTAHNGGAILALDFGGTKLSAAAVTSGERQWLALERRLSPPAANAQSDYRIAVELAKAVLGDQAPAAIGVSFGGPVWANNGTVKLSHHVPGWEGVPLAERLRRDLRAPVAVENDGIIAALGEHRYGAGKGVASLLYITASTGVGGGLVLNGQIWHGADGMAGHIGHLRLEQDGPECVCGSRGCLESIAAGPAIAREARARIAADPQRGAAMLKAAGGEPAQLTALHVAQLAAAGDPLALALIERAATALGVGIGSAANLLNPSKIIVGGGVSKAGAALWDVMLRTARETAMPEVSLYIAPAGLGDDAPLWGAVALAQDLLAVPGQETSG